MNMEEAITDLVLETFRLNGRLLVTGDALVADLGLTSARWQVLGAMVLSPLPLSVAQIARNMGLTRQAVQRLANEMRADGLVRFAPNPHHQRAKLVLLTATGKTAFAAVMKRQSAWATELGRGLHASQIKTAAGMLRTIRQRLDDRAENGGDNAA
jgi:DNA-binding MarR family transcriptional regulator